MISVKDYYGCKSHPALTPVRQANANLFINKVNRFIALGIQEGQLFLNSPATKTNISTSSGGWRSPECVVGAENSAHRVCRAIDLYDGLISMGVDYEGKKVGKLGYWILTSKTAQKLAKDLGLHFEHPLATKGVTSFWLHITDRPPVSGKMFFYP